MSQLLDLRGRVALVTGGGRGIGKAIGVLLSELGATTFLNYPQADAKPKPGAWDERLLLEADVSVPAASQAMLAQLAARTGRLDILVNNAGVYPRARPEDITEQQWDFVQGVNLKGAFFCTQSALGLLTASPCARVINIASVAAVSGPTDGAHYAASKAGLIALTKSLARSLGKHKVRVNAVAPGMTDTEQPIETAAERAALGALLPLGEIARPEDVARVVAFLASDLARYVTGQVIFMHGGVMQAV